MSKVFTPINLVASVKLPVLCRKVKYTYSKHNHIDTKGHVISESHNLAAQYVLVSFRESNYFGLWKTKH